MDVVEGVRGVDRVEGVRTRACEGGGAGASAKGGRMKTNGGAEGLRFGVGSVREGSGRYPGGRCVGWY